MVRADCADRRGSPTCAGRTVAVGAVDSPQATLHPAALTCAPACGRGTTSPCAGFDVGVGLHGDHIGGERDAARALVAGEVDAACMIDGNHLLFAQEGTLPPGAHPDPRPDRALRPLQHDRGRRRAGADWPTGSASCCCDVRTTTPRCGRCSTSRG